MKRIWRLLQCQRAEGWVEGGQGSTVAAQTDGLVPYLFWIDANVTGGSRPRRATGGDPAPPTGKQLWQNILDWSGTVIVGSFSFPSGREQCTRVGSAGVHWHGATLLLPALLLALPSHSEALVALFGNRGSAAPRPAGPSQHRQGKYTYETVSLGGWGGGLINARGCRR